MVVEGRGSHPTRTTFLVVIVLVAVAASTVRSEQATTGGTRSTDAVDRLARLERTPCLGYCPSYTVDISHDGAVRYEGHDCVMSTGTATGRLGPNELAELRWVFVHSGFQTIDEHCCDCRDRTDNPWAIITFADGGPAKTVRDYYGCKRTPKAIRSLGDKIDRIVRSDRWIGDEKMVGGASGRAVWCANVE